MSKSKKSTNGHVETLKRDLEHAQRELDTIKVEWMDLMAAASADGKDRLLEIISALRKENVDYRVQVVRLENELKQTKEDAAAFKKKADEELEEMSSLYERPAKKSRKRKK